MATESTGSVTRVDELLVEVLRKPKDERPAFLDLVCRDDAKLREELDGLLAANDEATGFMEHPVVAVDPTLGARLTEGPGTVIGRYKLLQLIGEGGFGAVYMAEQKEPVRRKVALKIIKLGMDTRQVIARFEAERQALAMMDHPNIARVLDAGATETGRPYFVMELVKGIPINEYCDTNSLSTRQRLELFIHVCNAVQHAHQKGIIHRDIKPTNVMITLHDGEPVPKVIDFGIAKATDRELTDKTLFTEFRQFIGTPEYMSPEQAEMSGLDIDTRSDIYSLGVLLYELLTGTTPFDSEKLRSVAYGEIQRIIREEEPHKPSTRVSTMGEEVTDIARHRKTDAGALNRLLRGDLDWIVMKALEKDRTRRYETASGLATDIRRHLLNEPVLATPPDPLYRIRKFVRRNQAAVTGGGVVAAGLVVGLTLAMTGFVQASHQRDLMEAEAAKAEAVSSFLQQMLASVNPAVAKGKEVSVRSMLDEAARKIEDGALAGQPEIEASVRKTIGDTYQSLGLYSPAESHLRKAFDIRVEVLGVDNPETLTAMDDLAYTCGNLGNAEEAERLLVKVVDSRKRELGEEHPDTLKSMYYLGWAKFQKGLHEEGEALHRKTLEIRRKVFGENHSVTALSWNCVGVVCKLQGRLEEAEPLFVKALEISRSADGPDHPFTFTYTDNLAELYVAQERYSEAEALLADAVPASRRVMGVAHERTVSLLDRLVETYKAQGRQEELRDLVVQTIDAKREQAELSGDDPLMLNSYAWLLVTCQPEDLRDPKTALSVALKANALTNFEHPLYLDTLALAHHLAGDTAEALEIQRKAVALMPEGVSELLPELKARLAEYEAAQDVLARDRR